MDEREPALDMQQRPRARPREQRFAVGRIEDVGECVALALLLHACRHAQQVQVVVAEDGERRLAQPLHEAQALERLGSAVDEVAGEPEAIARGIEVDRVQQPCKGRVAPLQVADRVGRQSYFAVASR